MFCLSCRMVKSEAGCYLAGMEKRVCLSCYMAAVNSIPLPSSAPPSLGGAFADGDGFIDAGTDTPAEAMQKVSESVAAGAAGIQAGWERKINRARETREAFWEEMPAPVQEYRNGFNQKRGEVMDEARGKINEVEDRVKEAAGGLLSPLEDFF